MTLKVLITGATGNVGSLVAKQLAAQPGFSVVAGLHQLPAEPNSVLPPNVEQRLLDFYSPPTYTSAMQGINTLFLMRPPAIGNVKRDMYPFLDTLRSNPSLKRVVLLSVIGADKNPLLPHRKLEQYLESASIPYSFLRPSFFMQNFSTTHLQEIKNNHILCVPAGHGKTNFIDVRDVADVAAACLGDVSSASQAYDLTGPDAFTYFEAAAVLSEELGIPITYTNPSLLQFYLHSRRLGRSRMQTLVMMGLYSASRFGQGARTTPTLPHLLHRPPTTFREFVRDYRSVWMPPPTPTTAGKPY